MGYLQGFLLALIQGLTEFLPISSSAHLILVPRLGGWPDQGLAFDVSVHVGTLVAVAAYFRNELIVIIRAWVNSVVRHEHTSESRLGWAVLLGTVPVGLCGLLFHDAVESELRKPLVIAATTILFALLLWLADWKGRRNRNEYTLRWTDVAIIGLAQAVAIIPGTSRSGITITAGLILGLERTAAARFSFLLSIPVIALAGGYETYKLLHANVQVNWDILLIGGIVSGLSAYACIHVFLSLLDRIGMLPFVIYRLLLGVLLLFVFI